MRRGKFNNKRTRGYASKKEAQVASDLHILAKSGKITDLREQVPFTLFAKRDGHRSVKYIADFVFVEDGKTVIMDAKGYRTDVYKLKKRMMLELLGIEIVEV